MNARRFVTWGKALIAVVAIGAAASPAKADLTLYFQEGNSYQGSFTVQNGSTGSINIGDFTGTYSVTASNTSAGVVQTLNIFNLKNNSSSAATFIANLQGTNYNTFAGGSAVLQAFTNVTSSTGASGSSVTDDSQYNGGTSDTQATVNLSGSTTTGSASSSTTIGTVGSNYYLRAYNTNANVTGGGTISYSVTAAIVPEPSGIVAAMAGLPCVGALLGFVRRRRVVAAVAAAQ